MIAEGGSSKLYETTIVVRVDLVAQAAPKNPGYLRALT
jgi:hypothetical protein